MNTQTFRSGSAIRLAAFSALALGLTAAPSAVLAGEAFVNTTSRYSTGYSTTDLNIKSKTFSDGQRHFASFADEIRIDGEIQVINSRKGPGKKIKSSAKSFKPSAKSFEPNAKSFNPNGVQFNAFTIQTASSSEFGNETFGERTKVDGTVFIREDFTENSHTTSAGIR